MDFSEIISSIAKANDTTPEEVLREMQAAIDEAYNTRKVSGQPIWNKMHFKFGRPTPEEFITQIARLLKENDGSTQ